MEHHPVAAAVATIITGRDPRRLAVALTPTARLRALLPGGPIEAHGRDDVAARFHGFFADFDTVRLVDSAGEAVGERLLVHYRLHVTQGATRWVCTQTAVCRFVDGRLAVIDMLCSGFREIGEDDDDIAVPSGTRRVG
jgi:hypothetical protein